MKYLIRLIESWRPKQWIKNLIVFAALIFAQKSFILHLGLKVFFAFLLFCGISSCIYLFNDLKDLKQDRIHPEKSKRPIASGKLPRFLVFWFLIIFLPLFVFLSFYLNFIFGEIILFYLILMIVYTLKLKEIVILDAFIISIGYVLRGIAGAVIVDVEISSWFFICSSLLALFIVFCKRRHEILVLNLDAIHHKKILTEYNTLLLDQFIAVVTSATVVTYSLYAVAPETIHKFNTKNLIFSVPFVLFGLFRYLYLVYKKGNGGSAENIMFSDKPLIVDMLGWLLIVFISIYFQM